MVRSSRWLGHGSFTPKIVGSNPTRTTFKICQKLKIERKLFMSKSIQQSKCNNDQVSKKKESQDGKEVHEKNRKNKSTRPKQIPLDFLDCSYDRDGIQTCCDVFDSETKFLNSILHD